MQFSVLLELVALLSITKTTHCCYNRQIHTQKTHKLVGIKLVEIGSDTSTAFHHFCFQQKHRQQTDDRRIIWKA